MKVNWNLVLVFLYSELITVALTLFVIGIGSA